MGPIARIGWIVAAALAVFVAWVALGTGSQVGIAFFYAVPIGLGGWWFGLRGGAVAAAACIALFAIGHSVHPIPDFGIVLAVRSALFLAVGVLTALARRRFASLEHSVQELETIRAALAPPRAPEIPGLDFGVAFVPSELGVSGDFYLATNGADGSTVVVVGDVVGHGPKAAELATFVRTQLAAFAASTSDPGELLTLINRAILETSRRDAILSAACLRLSAEDSRLAWSVAGHPRPLGLPDLHELDPAGESLLLGIDHSLVFQTAERALGAEEGVLVYTDGATEIRGAGREMLGIDGLRSLLAPLTGLPASKLVGEAELAILDWAEGAIRDDLCLLALRHRTD